MPLIKMQDLLQNLMSLLETAGYISWRGRGKSISSALNLIQMFSAQCEFAANVGLQNPQTAHSAKGQLFKAA